MNVMAQAKWNVILSVVLLFLFTLGSTAALSADYSAMSKKELQKRIAGFELGLKTYVVGKKLNGEQKKIAGKNSNHKAHPGTVKFNDGNVFVIIDKKTNVVIAVYTRNKKAGRDDFKKTISQLMVQYGEPTAMAHSKTLYWSYGEDGLISEELYRSVKSQGELGDLPILATIKFTSSENIETLTALVDRAKRKIDGEEAEEPDITSDNYLMIQSDLLSRKYIDS